MSESTAKRLRRENAVLAAEIDQLKARIDVHRDMELKLPNDILELKARVREMEVGE